MPLFDCPKCDEGLFEEWDSFIEMNCPKCNCKFTAEYDEIQYKDDEGCDVWDDFWHIELVEENKNEQ